MHRSLLFIVGVFPDQIWITQAINSFPNDIINSNQHIKWLCMCLLPFVAFLRKKTICNHIDV